VLRNEATTNFRHDTLDDALDRLNNEVGERDLWVLFELDRIRVAHDGVAEGRATSSARGSDRTRPRATPPSTMRRLRMAKTRRSTQN